MTAIAELFAQRTDSGKTAYWRKIVNRQYCPYLDRKCLKIRKSVPEVSIGTCSVFAGKDKVPIIICPHRLLERQRIFTDCLHLLTLHQPGNDLHVVSEITVPGGTVDYFVLSAREGRVIDFVGVELQTLDMIGIVWPARQRFLRSIGISVDEEEASSEKTFGMNWKMTAKTTLVQLHHKVETFEFLGKHLVLVMQDVLLAYMRRVFSFQHIDEVRLGDPMHFHAYGSTVHQCGLRLSLTQRVSTDTAGISRSLGLQAESKVEMQDILEQLQAKISSKTLLSVFPSRTEEISSTT